MGRASSVPVPPWLYFLAVVVELGLDLIYLGLSSLSIMEMFGIFLNKGFCKQGLSFRCYMITQWAGRGWSEGLGRALAGV